EQGIESRAMKRSAILAVLLAGLMIWAGGCKSDPIGHDVAAVLTAPAAYASRYGQIDEAREIVTYLASDELEGRGVGTRGLEKAAEFISDRFENAGLRPLPAQTGFFEPFEMTTASEIGPATALRFGDRVLAA